MFLPMHHYRECSLMYEAWESFVQRDSTRGANNLVGGEGRDGISKFQPCHIRG